MSRRINLHDHQENFDVIVKIRFMQHQVDEMKRQVGLFPEKYYSISHYVRIAVINYLKEQKSKERK